MEMAQYMVQTISVDHVLKEFYNALWKSANVKKLISMNDAMKIMSFFQSYLEKNMVIELETKYLKKSL